VLAFLIVALLGTSPIWVVIGSALFGLIWGKVRDGK